MTYICLKNNKYIDAIQMRMNKIIYFKYISFMLYVTVLIRHIGNFLFIQRITMFTQIISMFTHYFRECQPFLLSLQPLQPDFQKVGIGCMKVSTSGNSHPDNSTSFPCITNFGESSQGVFTGYTSKKST